MIQLKKRRTFPDCNCKPFSLTNKNASAAFIIGTLSVNRRLVRRHVLVNPQTHLSAFRLERCTSGRHFSIGVRRTVFTRTLCAGWHESVALTRLKIPDFHGIISPNYYFQSLFAQEYACNTIL